MIDVAAAAREMAQTYGVTVYGPNRHGHLVVSESDFARIEDIARLDHDLTPKPIWWGAALWGIPVEKAPDWTCDPMTVAWLRLVAVVLQPFRRIVRRLA